LSTVHSPGHGVDFWILSLHILSAASLAGAVNFVVTVHNMRTPGMSWMRIPLFIWTIVTYGWMLIIVLPVLSAGLTLMLLDRNADRRVDLQLAGDDLARQHLVRHTDAVGARLHRRLHHRRSLGNLPGGVPDRLAGDRHVLRRRPPALRALRRLDLRDLRRPLL